MSTTPHTLREKILERINRGDARMRPRIVFTLQILFVAVLCAVALALSIFLLAFIVFILRVGGHQSLLSFGPRGLEAFVFVFPWFWFFVDVVLVLLVVLLVRRFQFGYRRPALYITLAVFLFAGAAGLILDRGTSFNDDLLRSADNDTLPSPLGDLYETAHERAPSDRGIFRGMVTAIGTSTLTLSHDDFDRDHDDGTFLVIPQTGFDFSSVGVGDRLYVAGMLTHEAVEAYGISKIPEQR